MLYASFSVFVISYTLGCLHGALVNEIPRFDSQSVSVIDRYQHGKNRLIVVHVDGLLPDDDYAAKEKDEEKLQMLLSKLAKDTKNEVCLISGRPVEDLRSLYSDAEGVRLVGQNGKSFFEPLLDEVLPAQKLPLPKFEAIQKEILNRVGRHCEYTVKMGVVPLIIEPCPKSQEEGRKVFAELRNLRDALGSSDYKGSISNQRYNRCLAVFFEEANETLYPLKGLEERFSGVFTGSQGTLTPVPRDFGLSVGNEEAESFHKAMNKADFFSVTVSQEKNKQTSAKIGLSKIQEVYELLERLVNKTTEKGEIASGLDDRNGSTGDV